MVSVLKSGLAFCGLVLTVLSTLFHVIGFSTPHWLESFPQVRSRFDKIGLWTACFINFGYDRDNLGKLYDGCHWLYSYEYKPIFDWLNPQWLLTVQIMMTLALITNIITCALCILGRFDLMLPYKDYSSQLILSIGMFTSGGLIAISVTLFGIKADTDRQWIPRPDKNFLSWSFGLAIVGGFFAIFAAMCFLFDYLRLRDIDEKQKDTKDPYMNYRMKPVQPQF